MSQAGESPVLKRILRSPSLLNCASCKSTVFLLRQQTITSFCSKSSSRGKNSYPLALASCFSLRAKYDICPPKHLRASAIIPPDLPKPTNPTLRPVISLGSEFQGV